MRIVKIEKTRKSFLTQVAFGITGVQTNPDFLKMMRYCRANGVIPNFTLSGADLTDEMAVECSKLIGAVAVSAYERDKNVCYDTVKKFVDLGIKQTNIHLLVSKQSLPFVYEVLSDRQSDSRLQGMYAIVFLGLKPKNRGSTFGFASVEEFDRLIRYCLKENIVFGFDSCSAPKYEFAVRRMGFSEEQERALIQQSESCESSLMSSYINVFGEYHNCSFSEGEAIWGEGISVLDSDDFVADVWNSEKVKSWREMVLTNHVVSGCRECPVFPQINIK